MSHRPQRLVESLPYLEGGHHLLEYEHLQAFASLPVSDRRKVSCWEPLVSVDSVSDFVACFDTAS